MTTVTTRIYDIVESELFKRGFHSEIVSPDGRLTFFDNDRQLMTKIMNYDDDVKEIVNHLFLGHQLSDPVNDAHFKKTFYYRFINRQISRQTIESFQMELISVFMENEGYINKIYNEADKFLLQTSESDNTSKQTSHSDSLQQNQQNGSQTDQRTGHDSSVQNSGQDSTSSNNNTASGTTGNKTTGTTASTDKSAKATLPQSTVNFDVENHVMETANEHDVSVNKNSSDQTSNGTTQQTTTDTGSNHTDTTSSTESDSHSDGQSTSTSTGHTDSSTDSVTDSTGNTISKMYKLDELFKMNGLIEQMMIKFDRRCFLQVW